MSTEPTGDSASNAVRRFRRFADITQAQLAADVDVSRQTIVSIEGGDYSPSVYLALRIAAVLNTTVENLFGDVEPSTAASTTTHASN